VHADPLPVGFQLAGPAVSENRMLDAAYAPTSPGRVLATQALAVLVARGDPAADQLLGQLRGTGDVWGELQLDMCEVDLLLQRDQPQAALDVVTRTLAARGEQYVGETEGGTAGWIRCWNCRRACRRWRIRPRITARP